MPRGVQLAEGDIAIGSSEHSGSMYLTGQTIMDNRNKDRSALEIEITPEMIEAGVEELFRHPITEPTEDEMRVAVGAVFEAMIQAVRREASKGKPSEQTHE